MAPIGVTWLRALRAAPSLRCCLRAARAPRVPGCLYQYSICLRNSISSTSLCRETVANKFTNDRKRSLFVKKNHANAGISVRSSLKRSLG